MNWSDWSIDEAVWRDGKRQLTCFGIRRHLREGDTFLSCPVFIIPVCFYYDFVLTWRTQVCHLYKCPLELHKDSAASCVYLYICRFALATILLFFLSDTTALCLSVTRPSLIQSVYPESLAKHFLLSLKWEEYISMLCWIIIWWWNVINLNQLY